MAEKFFAKDRQRPRQLLNGLLLAFLAVFLLVFYWQARSAQSEKQENWGMADAKEVNVNSKTAGRVMELLVDEGDYVEAGQVIARLDTDTQDTQQAQALANLQAQYAQIQQALVVQESQHMTLAAAVNTAEAEAKRAEAARDLAARDEARCSQLLTDEVISRQAYDTQAAALKQAEASLVAALAQVESAKANLLKNEQNAAAVEGARSQAEAIKSQLDAVNVNIEETIIKAPFSGVITKRYVEEGSLISPTVPLFSLQDPGDNWVDFKVKETELSQYAVGDKLTLIGRDGQLAVPGTIESIRRKSDFATQKATNERGDVDVITFNVKVRTNAESVWPGMRFHIQTR